MVVVNHLLTVMLNLATSIFHRNPAADQRPKFRELLLSLLGKDDVLAVPQKALDTHPLAGVLGSPLEAGEGMYLDLKLMFEKKIPKLPPHRTVVFKQS